MLGRIRSGFDKILGDGALVVTGFGGRKQTINSGWFRGHEPRYRPPKSALLAPEAVSAAILDGWAPPAPLIDKSTRLLTFGSCFAGNIAKHLSAAGFNLVGKGENASSGGIYVVECNEGIVNTFTMRQMFEWVYHGKTPNEPTWRESGSDLYKFSEDKRAATKALFDSADVFIITLGLSEVWYNKTTGDVFSSNIPRAIFDEAIHGFRVSTIEENRNNLDVIYNLIRQHRPEARIILTLSPVPLMATFRNISCISANTVSKAILRVAIDEICRTYASDTLLHYWPSYEIVMEAFNDSFLNDNRHVREEVLTYIMTIFEKLYCKDGPSDDVILRTYFSAAAASGHVAAPLAKLIADGSSANVVLSTLEKIAKGPRVEEAILLARRYQSDHPDSAATGNFIERLRTSLADKENERVKRATSSA